MFLKYRVQKPLGLATTEETSILVQVLKSSKAVDNLAMQFIFLVEIYVDCLCLVEIRSKYVDKQLTRPGGLPTTPKSSRADKRMRTMEMKRKRKALHTIGMYSLNEYFVVASSEPFI